MLTELLSNYSIEALVFNLMMVKTSEVSPPVTIAADIMNDV